MLGTVTALAGEADNCLRITDERAAGTGQEFTLTGTLTSVQREAVADLGGHDLGLLVAPPGLGKTVVACALIAAGFQRRLACTGWRAVIPLPALEQGPSAMVARSVCIDVRSMFARMSRYGLAAAVLIRYDSLHASGMYSLVRT